MVRMVAKYDITLCAVRKSIWFTLFRGLCLYLFSVNAKVPSKTQTKSTDVLVVSKSLTNYFSSCSLVFLQL